VKGARILQLVLVIVLALYLVAFNNVNPDPLTLPLLPMLIPMPPVIVVVVALLAGWLVGWLPTRLALWRRAREIRRLRQRLNELEGEHTARETDAGERAPVIPDRFPVIPDRPRQRDEGTESS